MEITTNTISVQTVERTERIFVHSEASRPPHPGRCAAAGAGTRAGAGRRGGRHRAPPWVAFTGSGWLGWPGWSRRPNSTLPDVSSMNASSSEASGVSSCSTTDADAAISPIRAAGQAGDGQQVGAVARRGRGRAASVLAGRHGAARRGDQLGQPGRVRRAHPDRLVGAAGDHVLGGGLDDQLAPADHDQVVGGDRHLVHQVAGYQDGPALGGQLLHQVPDPQHALGVQPVHRLVQQQHLRVAEQGRGDAEPLAHAEGEAARPLVGHRAAARPAPAPRPPGNAAGPGSGPGTAGDCGPSGRGARTWPRAARRPCAAGWAGPGTACR